MGSKGRVPPTHLRRPLAGPGLLHPDPFGPGIHPPPGAFPFDMLPPPEILEQKLASQHVEMQILARENERFAATHSSLRQELAAAQQELQRLQNHLGAVKAEQEQQMRVLLDKIEKMEADLKVSDTVKGELQQAHTEAQSLFSDRQELLSRVQQLSLDLQRGHGDAKQIPALMSELEVLRQEYQHCRATYDYERKLRNDHFESLQLMEKNYMSMVREVEKLRAELAKATNLDRSGGNALGGQFGANPVNKESDASGHHSAGQNASGEVYGTPRSHRPSGGSADYGGTAGPASVQAGYDASKTPTHDASRSSSYAASRLAGYDAARSGSYEGPRGTGSEAPKGSGYDASRGAGGAQGAAATGNSPTTYGSTQVPSSYGAVPMPMAYGSAHQPVYGSAQQQNYGSALQPTYPAYGLGQPTYRSGQAPTYGSVQALAYGSGQTPVYGSGQAPAYGLGQNPAYVSGQSPTRAGGDYEAARARR